MAYEEEEEKGDNAGSMRAPKQRALIIGEDHGSSGNNQQIIPGTGSGAGKLGTNYNFIVN